MCGEKEVHARCCWKYLMERNQLDNLCVNVGILLNGWKGLNLINESQEKDKL
jgi:hypothetical protein